LISFFPEPIAKKLLPFSFTFSGSFTQHPFMGNPFAVCSSSPIHHNMEKMVFASPSGIHLIRHFLYNMDLYLFDIL